MSSTLSSSSSFAAGRVSRIWKLTLARKGSRIASRSWSRSTSSRMASMVKTCCPGRGRSRSSRAHGANWFELNKLLFYRKIIKYSVGWTSASFFLLFFFFDRAFGPFKQGFFFSLCELISAFACKDFCSLPQGSQRGAPAPHGKSRGWSPPQAEQPAPAPPAAALDLAHCNRALKSWSAATEFSACGWRQLGEILAQAHR